MDDMLDLLHSIKQAYRCPDSAAFVMSEDAYHELRKTKYFDGRYIWNPKFKDDGYDTLFGQVGFLLSERVDSKLVLKDAVKALKVAE